MVKKALIIFACLLTLIIVISIIISLVNLKPVEFQRVVVYEKETMAMKSTSMNASVSDAADDIPLLSNLLEHEKTIMISSIFIVIIFALLFYGAKRSKS